MRSEADGLPAHGAELLLPFPGTAHAAIERVGGKGQSLIRMAALGFAVPGGVVLTTDFFDAWSGEMRASPEWQALQDASPGSWQSLCAALKQRAVACPLHAQQQRALDTLRKQLTGTLFAVRSSSPQEDLQGASFAGGYETRLGVGVDGLVDAIRACFASQFDQRVVAYRAARGLACVAPRMAVVAQAQIDSQVAGVAFSMNPLNNDYDQVVIDANWGQGDTVVAGQVTPDHWVLDKIDGAVVVQTIGDKQVSRWLQSHGGLVDRPGFRCADACLTSDQLTQLVAVVARIEAAFQHPVDVEWAIAAGTIHVLQARPVTAFVPLPTVMRTAPGARRRLYMDIALSSGLTINAPISPMGLDVFRRMFSDLARLAFGPRASVPGGEDALLVLDGGRMYLDLSNAFWLGGPRAMAKKMAMSDAMLARTLAAIPPRAYRAPRRPAWARFRMLLRIPGVMWRLRRMLATCFLPFVAPERMHRRVRSQLENFERELAVAIDPSLQFRTFWERGVAQHLRALFDVSLPSVGPGVMAVQAFAKVAASITNDDPELRSRLDRGFEGNEVVAMSLAMHALAKQLPVGPGRDAEQLERQLREAQLPGAAMQGWNDFVRRFGCRGPMEMDVAHPRYGDSPRAALQQILAMSTDDTAFDPAAASSRQIERRRAAVATVLERAGPVRRLILQRLHRVIEAFAGLRDTPKHHLLMILHGLRQRIVLEGERLHREGRLDDPTHVFDLHLDELMAARGEPAADLRALRAARRPWYERLATQVINFPALIDSRGRILRPPPGARRAGEFCGVGLSPGLVTGRARTLRAPHEGPLLKGEVLVAYTTDPGWTPIFANATAVVLEIGGTLQHGAVVARELGLPCVAGIDGISTALRDGQRIEVDGSLGTVRLLPPQDD